MRILIFFVFLLVTSPSFAQRAMYWNLDASQLWGRDGEKVDDTILKIKSFGVSEVHIWVNDNLPPSRCSEFQYANSWNKAKLVGFIKKLQSKENNISVILTLSPWFQTKEFMSTLAGPNGPLVVANEVGGIPVEFDLEKNWTDWWTIHEHPCWDLMPTAQATEILLQNLKTISPKSEIHVTTTSGNIKYHDQIINHATVLSPQLYGSHYNDDRSVANNTITQFMDSYPNKKILPAFSIECRPEDASHCSKAKLLKLMNAVSNSKLCKSNDKLAYVLWAAHESHAPRSKNSCKVDPKSTEYDDTCSTFAETYLTETSKTPDLVCGKL